MLVVNSKTRYKTQVVILIKPLLSQVIVKTLKTTLAGDNMSTVNRVM